ncbi:MAG: universal stress protein [Acidimicrobiales bacterium]|nr:universal stress protein [Acidimicrobiales bacterium]
MRRFKNILFVPARGSQAADAEDQAVALATNNNARITFYGAVPPVPPLQEFVRLGNPPRSVSELLAHELSQTLQFSVKERDTTLGIDVAVDIGIPSVEIVRRVVENGHDLVILAADSTEDGGTLARRILRSCPCPVWVMRPGPETNRVLASVDPAGEPELNRRIVQIAQSLATSHAAELHIVHAWQFVGEEALMRSEHVELDARDLADAATDVEAAHRRQLDELLDAVGHDRSRNVHFVNASPVAAMAGLVEMYRIDVLTMGSVGRSDNDDDYFGNTAEIMFSKVPCSVLVVKPDGFVPPAKRTNTT